MRIVRFESYSEKHHPTLFSGLPEVGVRARGGGPPPRPVHEPRPALLPQLRADLVRVDEARGRANQDQVFRALSGAHQGARAAVQLEVMGGKNVQEILWLYIIFLKYI